MCVCGRQRDTVWVWCGGRWLQGRRYLISASDEESVWVWVVDRVGEEGWVCVCVCASMWFIVTNLPLSVSCPFCFFDFWSLEGVKGRLLLYSVCACGCWRGFLKAGDNGYGVHGRCFSTERPRPIFFSPICDSFLSQYLWTMISDFSSVWWDYIPFTIIKGCLENLGGLTFSYSPP